MLMLWSPFVISLLRRKAKYINVNMALSKARVKVVLPVNESALTDHFKSRVVRTTYVYTWTMLSNATHVLGDQIVGCWVNKTC